MLLGWQCQAEQWLSGDPSDPLHHRDVQAGANLSFNRQFYDEHWSKHRVVTCMDWSLQVRIIVGGRGLTGLALKSNVCGAPPPDSEAALALVTQFYTLHLG